MQLNFHFSSPQDFRHWLSLFKGFVASSEACVAKLIYEKSIFALDS